MKIYKSIIMSLFMLVIGAGCCTHTMPHPVSSIEGQKVNIVNHIENATVALVIGPSGERGPYCSGVWIDNEHILTAAHCTEVLGRMLFDVEEEADYNAVGDPVIFINNSDLENGELPKDTAWVGIVSKVDKKHDLALIESLKPTSTHTIVNISDEDIRPGMTVNTMGHPVGMFWTYIQGMVSATRRLQGPVLGTEQIEAKVLQVSAPVWMGNSGGGAFNSEGELIGICSWVTLRGPNISFFIHRDEIKKFLSGIN